jgi:hippurate hydrolase
MPREREVESFSTDMAGWNAERVAETIDLSRYISLRREFHTMPEPAYREYDTADRVAQELDRLGIPYERGWGGTGIVAWISGDDEGASVALRADMDALEMDEKSGVPYASEREGMMHACGHDGHMTMLLAAAEIISRHISFTGTVYLIFQPAEEGGGGAGKMVEEGLFDRFSIDRIYGLHNRPSERFGKFLVKEGPVMTSVDIWSIVLHGRSGHSSQPHRAENPISAAVRIVTALESISSRDIDPMKPHVVTVATIESGTAFNVIPGSCRIGGSVRAYDTEVQDILERRISEITAGMAEAFGLEYDLKYERKYPPTVNSFIDNARAAAIAVSGEEGVTDRFSSSMGSEDFSFFLRQREGCYVWLGMGKEGRETIPLHSARYDFDDDSIATGVAYWASLVEIELGK